jgi:DNA-binding XRE family transcriptional regulator
MAIMINEDSDLWGYTDVTLPNRSRLSHLEPIGVGTGFVESLTSYSARLAAVHNVTHASLFGYEISPLIDRKHLRNSESRLDRGAILAASFRTLVRAVNGTGVTARDYISSLETLTGRNNLCCLTMTIWANVIPHRSLLKPSKAWCPSCYEEFKYEKVPVFDPLIWSFSVVTTCAKHRLRLRTRCLRCDRTIPHLDSHSIPGFCSKCNAWLGQSPLEHDQVAEDIVGAELEKQGWVTKQLCTLLASTPQIENPPKKEAVTKSIKFCIRNIASMTESRFARAIGVAQPTVNDWQRQGNVPELEKLLRIAHFTQIPLLNILLGDTCNFHTSPGVAGSTCKQQNPTAPLHPHKRRGRIDIEKARVALKSALSVEPTTSLQDVARNLGYSSTALTKHLPVECKQLSEKYKQWRKSSWAKVMAELEKALDRDFPRSIRAIAKDLNRSHTNLYNYFPDLCRRIAQRYELYRRAHREQKKEIFRQEIREIVIAIHLEGLYPSVKRVEARLDQRRTIRHSKMALDTLRQVRAECGIPMAPNNFARFDSFQYERNN